MPNLFYGKMRLNQLSEVSQKKHTLKPWENLLLTISSEKQVSRTELLDVYPRQTLDRLLKILRVKGYIETYITLPTKRGRGRSSVFYRISKGGTPVYQIPDIEDQPDLKSKQTAFKVISSISDKEQALKRGEYVLRTFVEGKYGNKGYFRLPDTEKSWAVELLKRRQSQLVIKSSVGGGNYGQRLVERHREEVRAELKQDLL